jgi:hypothetical protein
MPKAENRWYWGVALTLIIIILQIFIFAIGLTAWSEVSQVKTLLINLHNTPSDTSGIPPGDIQDIRLKLNSIERFLRTTPLVECGNKDGPTKR